MNKYNLGQRVEVKVNNVIPDNPPIGVIERMFLKLGKVWYYVHFDKPLFNNPVCGNVKGLTVEEHSVSAI